MRKKRPVPLVASVTGEYLGNIVQDTSVDIYANQTQHFLPSFKLTKLTPFSLI